MIYNILAIVDDIELTYGGLYTEVSRNGNSVYTYNLDR